MTTQPYLFVRLVTLLSSLIILSACSSMKPTQFEQGTPRFLMEEYFLGKSLGQGMFYDRFNNLASTFTVELHGSMRGETLVLDEVLRYGNGEELRRIYEIERISENLYHARTEDVVGHATIESFGNTLRWSYQLKQKIGDSTWTLTFDDWMFLRENGVVLNRAFASKWGLEVGQVFMTVTKVP